LSRLKLLHYVELHEASWCTPINPSLRWLREEDCKIEASLSCLKTKKVRKSSVELGRDILEEVSTLSSLVGNWPG
jgi:hypothetical protein